MKQLDTKETAQLIVDAGQGQTESKPRSKKKLLWMISVVIVLSVAIIAGAFLYNGGYLGQAAKSNGNQKTYRPGPIYSFEPFIVNVAGTNATRYLRVCISVECASRKIHAKIAENELRIRDRILDLLCAQSIDGLLDVNQRDSLRATMAVTIGEVLGEAGENSQSVRSVYFSEFTIQ